MTPKLALAAAFCALPFCTLAQEPAKPDSIFKASAELGALMKTGNTKSGDIKTGFDIDYETGQWRSAFNFDLLVRKAEQTDVNGNDHFNTTDQKWVVNAQTNYTIDPASKNYVYGNASYEDNRFSNFERQSSISAGWGRRWLDNAKATFDAEIGPGFKQDVVRSYEDSNGALVPSTTQNALIIQAQALYNRHLNEHVDLKQILTAKIAPKSGENSKFKADTSITTKLIETLQLKFSFIIDYNTDVEDGRKNTDTETAVTLVYSF